MCVCARVCVVYVRVCVHARVCGLCPCVVYVRACVYVVYVRACARACVVYVCVCVWFMFVRACVCVCVCVVYVVRVCVVYVLTSQAIRRLLYLLSLTESPFLHRSMEGPWTPYHHDWYPDCPAVVHLRLR